MSVFYVLLFLQNGYLPWTYIEDEEMQDPEEILGKILKLKLKETFEDITDKLW
jgi:hypothetical protein